MIHTVVHTTSDPHGLADLGCCCKGRKVIPIKHLQVEIGGVWGAWGTLGNRGTHLTSDATGWRHANVPPAAALRPSEALARSGRRDVGWRGEEYRLPADGWPDRLRPPRRLPASLLRGLSAGHPVGPRPLGTVTTDQTHNQNQQATRPEGIHTPHWTYAGAGGTLVLRGRDGPAATAADTTGGESR